ncbi:dihydrolipoyl dehydrogenase [Virgibacillus ainsalahensis]
MENFDVVVIGAGPGGYVAAIRAAQLGKSVAIVEKNKLGGTCLNVGCIPSKALLNQSELVEKMNQADAWGIKTGEISIDFSRLMKRKDQAVQTLTGGVANLLKKNNITHYQGEAKIEEDLTVHIGEEKIIGKDILLATGSKPFVPPIKGLDKVDYVTTDTFFNLKELPKSLVIIGGGVIAVELASAMASFGTKVTIVEVAADILLTEERDVRKSLKKKLLEQNIQIVTKADIKMVKKDTIVLSDQEISFDTLLVAAGRRSNIELAEELGLKINDTNKSVVVNEYYETSKKHVYATGDLIGNYQLAHAASAEGIVAVHAMTGDFSKSLNQEEIPRCIYTNPEVASFGLSEEQAKEAGYDVRVTKSTISANSKAITMGETEGFLKIISEDKYQEILGAFIVGPNATELIGEILAVKQSEGTVNELSNVIQPHPSISEVIGEGANALLQRAIHM